MQAMKRAQASVARKDEARKKAGGGKCRSVKAELQRAAILRIAGRGANWARTRAQQDVALMMRYRPVLVATDPKRMMPSLLKLDGPAVRRRPDGGEVEGGGHLLRRSVRSTLERSASA
ncbi:hypothetical protein [Methylobacterium oryzae]|uniref:Transposase n=1 Tax=Methylobacterium oryzae TaxID=334852 RepID=A0ABU7TVJ7_9HYPH